MNLKIILKDSVLPHTGVHGRSEEHWGLRGHDGSGEHIVADAASHLTDDIGSTGGNHKEVASLGQRDMLDIETEVAIEGVDDALVVRQSLEGHRGDELRGVLRHDDMHIGIELYQHRCQIGNLIGSNASRHS